MDIIQRVLGLKEGDKFTVKYQPTVYTVKNNDIFHKNLPIGSKMLCHMIHNPKGIEIVKKKFPKVVFDWIEYWKSTGFKLKDIRIYPNGEICLSYIGENGYEKGAWIDIGERYNDGKITLHTFEEFYNAFEPEDLKKEI